MKRLLALLLAVCMIVGVIMLVASCGEEKTPDATTKSNTEATTKGGDTPVVPTDATQGGDTPVVPTDATQGGDTPVVPTDETTQGGGTTPSGGEGYTKPDGYLDVDFGGRTFSFVTTEDLNDPEDGYRWCTKREVEVDSRTGGTIIQTAVYDRNQVMKRLYNCEIKATEGSAPTLIQNDVNSGTNEYDIGIWQNQGTLTNKGGYYINIYNLNPDFNLPGWNKSFFDQLTVRDSNGVDKLYNFDADCNIVGYRATWVLYLNLDLYNANFTDNIFDIVKNGEWTIDKMMELMSVVAQDNGDQVWNEKGGDDVYGLITSNYNAHGLVTSMGIRLIMADPETHTFSTSVDQITANNAFEAINKAGEFYSLDYVNPTSYALAREEIQADRTLFMGEVLDVLERMKDNEDLNVTVLPEPLYEAQENPDYKFYVNTKVSYYAISKYACGGNTEMMSDFINLWVYHSNKIVYPAFRQAYGSIFCQDERAMEMLDYILNGRVYELAYIKGTTAYGEILKFISTGKNDLNRAANKLVKGLQEVVDTFVADMEASE